MSGGTGHGDRREGNRHRRKNYSRKKKIYFTNKSTPSLTELLSAAEFCGIRLCRVDTLPPFEEYGEDTLPLSCVLDAAGGDLTTFRRFLSLEASEDTVMGLYGSV